MGQMKRVYMALQERGLSDREIQNINLDDAITLENLEDLNFDLRDAEDPDWWRQQDADLDTEEMKAIEAQADIESERLGFV